jgi:hypothetical protein
VSSETKKEEEIKAGTPARLKRVIRWYDGFALSVAVPGLLIYSAGPMAGLLGVGSIVVWCISMTIAVFLVFGYAELAGLFPQKTGGFGVFQYIAWRNSDFAKRHPYIVDLVGVVGVWGY